MSVGMLRELGYGVVEAGNGAEALAMLEKQGSVALMFTDVVMPGLTGRALGRRGASALPGPARALHHRLHTQLDRP